MPWMDGCLMFLLSFSSLLRREASLAAGGALPHPKPLAVEAPEPYPIINTSSLATQTLISNSPILAQQIYHIIMA